ncbi:hypothetical protein [Umezawaea sp. NPDC059074]|uniref:hypothetical protein n=1 Tax=Umezawaea sp. NPDC059074 TaxID=3346716 RepID=UPI00367C5D95
MIAGNYCLLRRLDMTSGSRLLSDSPRCRDSMGLVVQLRARRVLEASRLDALRPHLRRPVPSTVWLCGQDAPRLSPGAVATWLLVAVAKIVTTYTEPGQRVLLLVAPRTDSAETKGLQSSTRTGRWRSRYDGLKEASWAVSRLGRGVRCQLVGTRANSLDHSRDCHSGESESAPGLRAAGPILDSDVAPGPDGECGPGGGPSSYDLIIAAVEPRTADWFRPSDWAGLLEPDGVLTVITHGDHSHGRFTERVGSLVRAAQLTGLTYLDRITVVNTAVHNGASREPIFHEDDTSQPKKSTPVTTGSHNQAHDDLLVFVHKSLNPSRPVNGEASDD